MRTVRIILATCVCLSALLLMGQRAPREEDPPPPTDTMKKLQIRPKLDASDAIDTMLGSMPMLEGYEEKSSTDGTVRLQSPEGIVIVIDALAADSVKDAGYGPDSVLAILAKQFAPRMVKDPEEPGGDVALRFTGYGSIETGSVAFVLDLVDTPSRGPGSILVYGPNSLRDLFPEMSAEVIALLLSPS